MVIQEECSCSCHWDNRLESVKIEHSLVKRMFTAVKRSFAKQI